MSSLIWNFPLEHSNAVFPDELGSFAYERKNHIHEGIDLYATQGQNVYAVETGVVVHEEWFTGEKSVDNSSWWNNTQAVMVEGFSGVVLYGEILTDLKVGDIVNKGDLIGTIETVLKKDKGRPMSMLHLELHDHGSKSTFEWPVGTEKPKVLLDPTEYVLEAFFEKFKGTEYLTAKYCKDNGSTILREE